jgi:hypothetical protein
MMSKERQHAELHKTIWRIANDLRGSIDAIVANLEGAA